jgi:hypothetical protein
MGNSTVCLATILLILVHVESPQNGQFYGLFWKPVDFGAQTVTDELARFHRIAQKRAIL